MKGGKEDMTDNKRFVHIEHKGADYILDNPNWDLDYIEMLGDTLEEKEIVDLLNELHYKNVQLNRKLKQQKKVCNLLEGFLLNKGYSVEDVKKFGLERMSENKRFTLHDDNGL